MTLSPKLVVAPKFPCTCLHGDQLSGLLRRDDGGMLFVADMVTLLTSVLHLSSPSNEAPLLLVKDGLLFTLLGQPCFRGFYAGNVRLDNLVLPMAGSAVPPLLPCLGMGAGAKLHVKPDCTKNKTRGRGQLTLICASFCFTSWLHQACPFCCCHSAHHQLSQMRLKEGY